MLEVYSSSDPVKVHYILSILKENSIEAVLRDEQMNSILFQHLADNGGLKITVAPEDASKALEIIEDLKNVSGLEKEPVDSSPDEDQTEFRKQWIEDYRESSPCPVCGSYDIEGDSEKKTAFISLLKWMILPFRGKLQNCLKCGAEWKSQQFSPVPFIIISVILSGVLYFYVRQ